MRFTVALLAITLLPASVLAADPAPQPLSPSDAVKAMKLPAGFTATLVAAEPDVVQPISFCIDDRGRLIVAEAMNYGAWQATGKDRIIILEDADGDGRAEKRTVFYEGLNYVTGIEVGFGGVYAVSPPNLYFIPDKDGDDKPDGPPEILFDGFGYKESRHNLVNGFTWGPDGWLYFGHGRTSPSDVGRPGTPPEKRIHCDGGVCRIHPTRLVFENFADGTTNPWGVDFDDYGACFVSNCVNPHLFHMVQGGHYEPWRNRPSSKYAYERIPTCADHLHYPGKEGWQASRAGKAETLAMGGGHAHCGTLIYLGHSFPAKYRNTVMMCNVHGKRINNDILTRKGSSYIATHGDDFMLAGDPWFMGVTLQLGPDGSVYVSDWSDTGECHTYKPQKHTGRIYKISYKGDGPGPSVPAIDRDSVWPGTLPLRGKPEAISIEDLVKYQAHSNDWHVRHARRLLQERVVSTDWNPEKSNRLHVTLRTYLSQGGVQQQLRHLWALHVTHGLSADDLFAIFGSGDKYQAHLRAWAIQLACEEGRPSDAAISKFSALARSDESPVVRLYLASALQRIPLEDRWPIIASLIAHEEDAKDTTLSLMYWYALEPLVAADKARALQLVTQAKIPLIRQFIARRAAEK